MYTIPVDKLLKLRHLLLRLADLVEICVLFFHEFQKTHSDTLSENWSWADGPAISEFPDTCIHVSHDLAGNNDSGSIHIRTSMI